MDKQFAEQLIIQLAHDYNTIAEHFSTTRNQPWPEFEQLASLIRSVQTHQHNGVSLLDIGCGNGRLAEIARKIKTQYTGIDIAEHFISLAKQRYPEYTFVQASMLDLPFNDCQFNMIAAIASLQHIPSEQLRLQALRELYRVTAPEGTLFMTNWNLYQDNLLNYFINDSSYDTGDALIPWKNDQGKILAERYYHGFTIPELTTLLNTTGWEIISQVYSRNNQVVEQAIGHNILTIAKRV